LEELTKICRNYFKMMNSKCI